MKQSIYPLCRAMDCFASLAMTVEGPGLLPALWSLRYTPRSSAKNFTRRLATERCFVY